MSKKRSQCLSYRHCDKSVEGVDRLNILKIFLHTDLYFPYLENDGRAWFLLQDTSGAEGLEVRVRVVEEVGVVVDQQRLDVVEDEPKLVRVLHCVQTRMVLRHQGGSEAAHTGGVQYFTHLGRDGRKENVSGRKSTF